MPAAILARAREALAAHGPLTGAALQRATGVAAFPLWRACVTASDLLVDRVGRRYLRFDRTVEGFARLSPSILREFLTYTVVGLPSGPDAFERAVVELSVRIRVISRSKLRTATRVVEESFAPLVHSGAVDQDAFCALIAGDIVHGMSHSVTRREASTGTLVDGSDLDVVVLVSDGAADAVIPLLDQAILARKWYYLRNPGLREEVDYVVKPLSRLREQTTFDTFTKMVACKVFDEAEWVFGSKELHAEGLALLDAAHVPSRLRELEFQAASLREDEEAYLAAITDDVLPGGDLVKFYTDEEQGEFEH